MTVISEHYAGGKSSCPNCLRHFYTEDGEYRELESYAKLFCSSFCADEWEEYEQEEYR